MITKTLTNPFKDFIIEAFYVNFTTKRQKMIQWEDFFPFNETKI